MRPLSGRSPNWSTDYRTEPNASPSTVPIMCAVSAGAIITVAVDLMELQLMDHRIDDGRHDGADITSFGCRCASEPDHPQQHLAQLARTSQLSLEASALIRTSIRTHKTRSPS